MENPKSSNQNLNHLAIILDGNRRWAKAHGLPKIQGHKKGYDNLKKIALAAFDRGIKYFSAFVFSTENWNRDKGEVDYLMDLVIKVFTSDLDELDKKNVKIRIIGSRERLSAKMIEAIESSEQKTKDNDGGVLCLCFNYGGRNEIVQACKQIVNDGLAGSEITETSLKDRMYTHDIPDPDMIVRTSGEMRLSNFLLWGSAYAELEFIDIHWPDFNEDMLDKVLADFAKRNRRLGK
ncbi:MAG: polyprenyl diphosphate synthase [bacterium]|nr:polyprenyl diphosphate synthase [bacterium]